MPRGLQQALADVIRDESLQKVGQGGECLEFYQSSSGLSHWIVAEVRLEPEGASQPESVPSKETLVVAYTWVGRGQSRNKTLWKGLIIMIQKQEYRLRDCCI